LAKKERIEWSVFGRSADGYDHFLGSTRATSETQACNLVRDRVYPGIPFDQIALAFWAQARTELDPEIPEPRELSQVGPINPDQLELF